MIVDIHTHAYPEKIAAMVMRPLAERSKMPPVCDGTVAGTKKLMCECGIDRFVLLPVATTLAYFGSNNFARDNGGDMLVPFGTLHPAVEDIEGAVEQIAELGLRGIKLHPQYLRIPIDDERYVRVISRAAALHLPVIYHAGADLALPPPCMALPRDTARLLDRVEMIDGAVLIAAHLGGFDMFDDVEKYLVGRNIWFDTACIAGRLTDEQYRRIIERHGYQRILFGSDCPWQSPSVNLAALRALALPPEQEQAILGGNACRLLGL